MSGELKNLEMHYSEDGKTLVIEIDLTKDYGASSTGKTNNVATSAGNIPVSAPAGRGDMRLGLNCYEYPKDGR